MQHILGILGGMGPLATVDFMEKIIRATPAERDQDHVPVITASIPQIPDRSDAITGTGPSPLTAMVTSARRLQRAGAQAIAIPCNTAHRWHADIERHTDLPMFHMADAAVAAVTGSGVSAGSRVGILATTGTLAFGMYQQRLAAAGMQALALTDQAQDGLVMAGIRAVKAGDTDNGGAKLAAAADGLLAQGAERIILACTEIPPALAAAGRRDGVYIDATDALARACVDWALDGQSEFAQQAA